MITIEITDPKAIVNQHKGWLTGLAGTVAARLRMIDLAEKVEDAVVERLIEELGEDNVRISVSGAAGEISADK